MTDKEKIASIAKAYANYLDPDNKCNRTMIEVDCIGFVEWLKEEFEIVSKEKVREQFGKSYKLMAENSLLSPDIASVIRHDKGVEGVNILTTLFPQTLKSEEQ